MLAISNLVISLYADSWPQLSSNPLNLMNLCLSTLFFPPQPSASVSTVVPSVSTAQPPSDAAPSIPLVAAPSIVTPAAHMYALPPPISPSARPTDSTIVSSVTKPTSSKSSTLAWVPSPQPSASTLVATVSSTQQDTETLGLTTALASLAISIPVHQSALSMLPAPPSSSILPDTPSCPLVTSPPPLQSQARSLPLASSHLVAPYQSFTPPIAKRTRSHPPPSDKHADLLQQRRVPPLLSYSPCPSPTQSKGARKRRLAKPYSTPRPRTLHCSSPQVEHGTASAPSHSFRPHSPPTRNSLKVVSKANRPKTKPYSTSKAYTQRKSDLPTTQCPGMFPRHARSNHRLPPPASVCSPAITRSQPERHKLRKTLISAASN